ncbi:hypothetical protein PIB30_015798 [Stylosanthes scabra]|uniref:Uncharacterized protein n=1 Tax=Stylosanthes scabra TaxID=79078 RepID=A0ABU6Z5I3_9FABA|nr:hypothetical protein [Stylosanthes scabra]
MENPWGMGNPRRMGTGTKIPRDGEWSRDGERFWERGRGAGRHPPPRPAPLTPLVCCFKCFEEVIKETQLRLCSDPTEGALHDNGKGINLSREYLENEPIISNQSLPTGFEDFVQAKEVPNIHKGGKQIDVQKEEEIEEVEDDVEKSFTGGDDENESIEEGKNTLQLCEKCDIIFNEEEDMVLATLRKKKKKSRKMSQQEGADTPRRFETFSKTNHSAKIVIPNHFAGVTTKEVIGDDSMAQWIRRWSTEPEILGSIPSGKLSSVTHMYLCPPPPIAMVPSNVEGLAHYVLPNSDSLHAGGSDGLQLMARCVSTTATSADRHPFGTVVGGANLCSVVFSGKGGSVATIVVVSEGGVPFTDAHPCSPLFSVGYDFWSTVIAC